MNIAVFVQSVISMKEYRLTFIAWLTRRNKICGAFKEKKKKKKNTKIKNEKKSNVDAVFHFPVTLVAQDWHSSSSIPDGG